MPPTERNIQSISAKYSVHTPIHTIHIIPTLLGSNIRQPLVAVRIHSKPTSKRKRIDRDRKYLHIRKQCHIAITQTTLRQMCICMYFELRKVCIRLAPHICLLPSAQHQHHPKVVQVYAGSRKRKQGERTRDKTKTKEKTVLIQPKKKRKRDQASRVVRKDEISNVEGLSKTRTRWRRVR